MNPSFLGDSYDLVKRFFCRELAELGYVVSVDGMLTGNWNGTEHSFYRLIGAEPRAHAKPRSARSALFLDPDTGVKEKGGKQHVSFTRLAEEASQHVLVFAFDQSFSYQHKPGVIMHKKLASLRAQGCHAMYYDSHARFLFAAKHKAPLYELHKHLVSLGLPASRLLASA